MCAAGRACRSRLRRRTAWLPPRRRGRARRPARPPPGCGRRRAASRCAGPPASAPPPAPWRPRRSGLVVAQVSSRSTSRTGSSRGAASAQAGALRPRRDGPARRRAAGLLSVGPRRASAVHITGWLTPTPCSASAQARNSAMVASGSAATRAPARPAGARGAAEHGCAAAPASARRVPAAAPAPSIRRTGPPRTAPPPRAAARRPSPAHDHADPVRRACRAATPSPPPARAGGPRSTSARAGGNHIPIPPRPTWV